MGASGMAYAKVLRQEIPQCIRGKKKKGQCDTVPDKKGSAQGKVGRQNEQDFGGHGVLFYPECKIIFYTACNGKAMKVIEGL